MSDTFVSVAVAVGVVLPGFVAAQLTQRGRAMAASGDGQSIVLHALFYALLIHLAWIWWTWPLAHELATERWQAHLDEIAFWAAVVLIASPIAVGLSINELLRRAEKRGPLAWWHYALGGRDARGAWDFAFQRAAADGAWVLVHLKGSDPAYPRVAVGKFGRQSAIGQSPTDHDLYLQELWTVDTTTGLPVARIEPRRGMWVAQREIAEIYFLDGASDAAAATVSCT